MKPSIVLTLSLIYLAFSVLFWFIWPLVTIRMTVGVAFTLVNIGGLIIFFWKRRKKSLPRPQPDTLIKIATFIWFLTIFSFFVTSTIGGLEKFYVKNNLDYKNIQYFFVEASGCSIECFVSFNVYRCVIGDFICIQATDTVTYFPNYRVNSADYSLEIDSTTGELNLLNKGVILRTIH